MNRPLKIGLIGFISITVLTIILRIFGIPPVFSMPFALPFGMLIVIGALRKRS